MSEERYLTFALGKGRLANKTMELLEKVGINCEEIKDKNSRKLVFVNEELKLKFFLAKGPDVPTYVEHGAADIGVVGKDTLLEEGKQVYRRTIKNIAENLLEIRWFLLVDGFLLYDNLQLLDGQ